MLSKELLFLLNISLDAQEPKGIKYDEMMKVGNWELIFSKPRADGQLPVIKHALYTP